MLSSLYRTISSNYREALTERLQKLILPSSLSRPLQQTKATIAARYPEQITAKAIEAITHTERITEGIGKILAKAAELKPVVDERGYKSPGNFQNAYYLGKFLHPLNSLIHGKQKSEIIRNQMERQVILPKEFSEFLDKTLPEIAKAAESRRNIITELTEHFVSEFKKEVQEHLGDYALEKLEKLDSLIVQNLKEISKFNLDRYTGELTRDESGKLVLNIDIGVNNQGLSAVEENSKASLLRDIAVNIQTNGFQVWDVSNEVGQGYQDVYRIAVPLEKPTLPKTTLN